MSNTEKHFYVRRVDNVEVALVLEEFSHLQMEEKVTETKEDGSVEEKVVKTPITTRELVHKACGEDGVWHSLQVKPWTSKDRAELETVVTSIGPSGQSIRDNERAFALLVSKAVTSWTLRKDNLDLESAPLPVSEESYNSLSDSLCETIKVLVELACYPPKLSGVGFTKVSLRSS